MADVFRERHHDYVFEIGASPGNESHTTGLIGPLVAGQQYTGIPLQLDADAPFILRSIAARMQWDLEQGQAALANIFIRMKRANGDLFVSNLEWIPLLEWTGNFGLGGNPYPIWPHEIWPRNGVAELDVWNNGPADIAGFQLVYRGVKRYAPEPGLYPKKFQWRNFVRSVKIPNVGVSGSAGIIRNFLLPRTIDADYVMESIQAGCLFNDQAPEPFFAARNVWVILRDQDAHGYSNKPLDWNILAGCGFIGYPTGGFNFDEQTGPFHPGLLYPEIYVPQNQVMQMDIYRDDSPYVGAGGLGAVRLDFAFNGGKVFQR